MEDGSKFADKIIQSRNVQSTQKSSKKEKKISIE